MEGQNPPTPVGPTSSSPRIWKKQRGPHCLMPPGRRYDSEICRLQQVGSAPSSLFFESLINFQETSPDNCHEAAPAKQTQTELLLHQISYLIKKRKRQGT